MLKKLVIVLLVLLIPVGVFAAYIAMQPADFKIERSAVVNASPDAVFAQVNDFHKWDAWSPWAKLDPNSVSTFEGPTSGQGAIFKWAGNDQVGEGKMTITESKPAELVRIKLDFFKPMAATNDTLFTFAPQGSGTEVKWTMTGQNGFVGRAFCTLFNMQEELAKQFDKGLASMKAAAEGTPSVPQSGPSAVKTDDANTAIPTTK